MIFIHFLYKIPQFWPVGAILAPHAKNEEFYRENALKTMRGLHNVRRTFQAIHAGVLERFPVVSPRFLQFSFIFPSKIVHLGHFGVPGYFPKAYPIKVPPLTGGSENFCQNVQKDPK